MNIDNTILQLFSPFKRNVGNPYQFPIRTQKDFEDFLIRNNGLNDCSASVYADDGVIDKIWFDFDGEGAIEEAKQLYDYLKFLECKVIPVISGKKGIHLHLLVNSTLSVNEYDARVQLMDACQSIIANGLGIKDWKQKTTLDWSKVGAIKTTCRIPNTMRPPENTTWCSFLPEDWSSLSNNDVWDYAKSPHTFNYSGNIYSLAFFVDSIKLSSSSNKFSSRFSRNYETRSIQNATSLPQGERFVSYRIPETDIDGLKKFLEPLMRPCLHKHLFTDNPNNAVRVASTIDFLGIGLSPDQILNIFSRLNWTNYNEGITKEKVTYIADRHFNNDINSYSCTKIHTILQLPRSYCYD